MRPIEQSAGAIHVNSGEVPLANVVEWVLVSSAAEHSNDLVWLGNLPQVPTGTVELPSAFLAWSMKPTTCLDPSIVTEINSKKKNKKKVDWSSNRLL